MSHRRQARAIALQILYSLDVLNGSVSVERAVSDYFLALAHSEDEEKTEQGMEMEIDQAMKDFASQLVDGVWQNLSEIDTLVAMQTDNWDFERLAKTDKAILRLGCFELLYRADIPHRVSINEAIELAKLYGEDNSPSFVNGILDGIALKTQSIAKASLSTNNNFAATDKWENNGKEKSNYR